MKLIITSAIWVVFWTCVAVYLASCSQQPLPDMPLPDNPVPIEPGDYFIDVEPGQTGCGTVTRAAGVISVGSDWTVDMHGVELESDDGILFTGARYMVGVCATTIRAEVVVTRVRDPWYGDGFYGGLRLTIDVDWPCRHRCFDVAFIEGVRL